MTAKRLTGKHLGGRKSLLRDGQTTDGQTSFTIRANVQGATDQGGKRHRTELSYLYNLTVGNADC